MMDPTTTTAQPAGVGQVEIADGYATLRFTRQLPHPPEVVWAALTEAEQYCKWFATTAEIDGRPGGSVVMVSGPAQMRWTGRILTWDPPRVFEHEWHTPPRPEIPNGEAESVVRWELTPSEQGTTLILTHSRLTVSTGTGFAPGTHAYLDRLAAYLDQQPLPSWWGRYQEVQHAYPARQL